MKDYILLLVFILFFFNANLVGQTKIELQKCNYDFTTCAELVLDGKKYKITSYDVNNDSIFGEIGEDAINIRDLDNFQLGVIILTRSDVIVLLYGKKYQITNIDSLGKYCFIHEIEGEAAPDITLRETLPEFKFRNFLPDTTYSIEAFLNQKDYDFILINIWSTSCPPCIEALEYYPDLKKFNIKTINFCYENDEDVAIKLIKEKQIPGIHSLIDRQTMSEMNASGFPGCFLYDKDLKLVCYLRGVNSVLNFVAKKSKDGQK